MLRVLKLIFGADKEWEKMGLNPPNATLVFLFSLLPLLAVSLAVEGWGLLKFGEYHRDLMQQVRVPEARVIKYVVFYAITSLTVITVGSFLLNTVGQSFNLQSRFGNWFVLMGYGYAPIFLLRIADAFPRINTWVCWGIAVFLSLRILYHGVAHWLKPEQTKGLGIFMICVIYIVILSGLVHFASIQVLKGRFLRKVYPDQPVAVTSSSSVAQFFYVKIGELNGRAVML
jgi:hypothetical protein